MVLFVVASSVLDINFAMFTRVYEIGVYDLVILMFNIHIIPAGVYFIMFTRVVYGSARALSLSHSVIQ